MARKPHGPLRFLVEEALRHPVGLALIGLGAGALVALLALR